MKRYIIAKIPRSGYISFEIEEDFSNLSVSDMIGNYVKIIKSMVISGTDVDSAKSYINGLIEKDIFHGNMKVHEINLTFNNHYDLFHVEIDGNKNGKIKFDGDEYQFEHKCARNNKDFCLATKDPTKYANGFYLYSDKDPGSGMEFVIVDTTNQELKNNIKERS
jgi:hypothetical protein